LRVSTFNADAYFFVISEKLLHANMQKHTKNHREFICREKIKDKGLENCFFSYAKLLHPMFRVTFRQR